MGSVKGGARRAPTTLRACEEQALLGYAAGKTNLTTDQLVGLHCSAFPQSYSQPQPTKRRKTGQAPVTNMASEEDESPDSEGNSDASPSGGSDESGDGGRRDVDGTNRPISRDLGGSDELGDVNRNNRPMFRDLGGMDSVINELTCEVIVPLHQPELMHRLGVEPAARILLHGPSGCGKTTLARALANEAGLPLYEISAADLVSGASGAPEENIRELFFKAYMKAPSVVFIDEIDAMTSKMENLQMEVEPRIVNQLMACMDEPNRVVKPVNQDAGSECSNSRPGYVHEPNRLVKPVNQDAGSESSNSRPKYVLVIGATNRPDALDPALRRRFAREIVLDAPEENGRNLILSLLTRNLNVEDRLNLLKVARCTLGFVGGDLVALVKKAGIQAVKRIMDTRKYKNQTDGVQFEDYYRKPFSNEEMKNVSITMADFVEAAKIVRPSSILQGFSTTPYANWDDVGGLHLLKLEFERHIVKRIKFPEVYKDLRVYRPNTFFLYGPSGCGKTLIVKALANEAGASFLYIKGSKLLTYGDQSELMVHIIFNYARTCSPCILFFDELEAIIQDGDEAKFPNFEKLVIELSEEQDGGLYVIIATNSPGVVTHLSTSRIENFDMILHVPLPRPGERGAILKALARNKPIDASVDLMALGKNVACENFSGGDLYDLMAGAVKTALDRQSLSGRGCRAPWTIKGADFKGALANISPSVSTTEVKKWELVPAECEASLEWS